jgi:hypothetical protein
MPRLTVTFMLVRAGLNKLRSPNKPEMPVRRGIRMLVDVASVAVNRSSARTLHGDLGAPVHWLVHHPQQG